MYTGVESTTTTTDWIIPVIVLVFGLAVLALIFLFFKNRYLGKRRIEQAKDLVMFKVLVPKEILKKEEQVKEDFREVMSVAEQLISTFSSFYRRDVLARIFGQDRLALEIIVKDGIMSFYVGVPRQQAQFMEKQIHGFYPHAQIEESKDFKIFSEDISQDMISVATLKTSRRFIYPIKTYKQLESDPLNGLTNVLSKLPSNSRANIQLLLRPTGGDWRHACSRAARWVQEGRFLAESDWYYILFLVFDFIANIFRASTSGKQTQMVDQQQKMRFTPYQEELMKAFREKGSKVGFKTQIKIMVIAEDEALARLERDNILNSFSQFTAAEWNKFKKISVRNKEKFIVSFILREFTKPYSILNTEEIASIFHFPNRFIETPNIKWLMSKFLAPPTNLPEQGTVIGKSVFRGEEKLMRIQDEDRRRHIFMIGKTGVGKTTLFENMIKQDILAGRGVCFIDPLGDAIEHILQMIPKERAEDVVIFDPSDTERPLGLNLLEWTRPEERDFLVAEWIEIFYKLFDPQRTGIVGPQFEHWGRNASLTVMSQPDGGTLIEIPRLFTDDAFREHALQYLKDPVVESFWNQQLAKTADFHKSEMFNYFISKFGRFMTNDLMRNIIGQKKSAFNLREIMDQGKIFLVNLSKGKIGETNSYLLGMILVAKIQVAAFSRADTPEEQRPDFYLYVDEFQNFTTDTFKTILSEARKYHLNLAITNQYIAQLTEPVRDAVIGNAGTLIVYRIGAADAEFMAKEFPGISEQDMTNLDKYTTYTKLLIDLTPSKPFSMLGIKPEPVSDQKIAAAIRQLSRLKYGRERSQVEEEIRESYKEEEYKERAESVGGSEARTMT